MRSFEVLLSAMNACLIIHRSIIESTVGISVDIFYDNGRMCHYRADIFWIFAVCAVEFFYMHTCFGVVTLCTHKSSTGSV